MLLFVLFELLLDVLFEELLFEEFLFSFQMAVRVISSVTGVVKSYSSPSSSQYSKVYPSLVGSLGFSIVVLSATTILSIGEPPLVSKVIV